MRRRALSPNRSTNGLSQRPSSSFQSNVLPTMVGPSKGRPPMSHRKTDLGILCRSKICQSSASLARQNLWPGVPPDPARKNVFMAGKTYNFFLVYANKDTEQTYQMYVGTGLTPATDVKLIRANIDSAPFTISP